MKHITTTSFGQRAVSHAQLAHATLADCPVPCDSVDKWAVLQDLTTARAAFGLSPRTLSVLSALLSFLPGHLLRADGDTMVFPSNRKLSERTHGMAESTLRRHIAALVKAGLILRHDSPNGKRYARRNAAGAIDRAFGFDMRPLLVRSGDIADTARGALALAEQLRALREEVVLTLRDITQLMAFGTTRIGTLPSELTDQYTDLQRAARRKLNLDAMSDLRTAAQTLLSRIRALLPAVQPYKPSGNDSQNERHQQSSNQNTSDSETPQADMPLHVVLTACPDVADYVPDGIRQWHHLEQAAEKLHPMLGITRQSWRQAQAVMGQGGAAVTFAAILQKGAHIANPGAYLRRLTQKAETGRFDPGPMVMALLRAGQRVDSCQLGPMPC